MGNTLYIYIQADRKDICKNVKYNTEYEETALKLSLCLS